MTTLRLSQHKPKGLSLHAISAKGFRTVSWSISEKKLPGEMAQLNSDTFQGATYSPFVGIKYDEGRRYLNYIVLKIHLQIFRHVEG